MAEFIEVMRHDSRMRREVESMEFLHRMEDLLSSDPARFERAVMRWAELHPEKTMKDVFFEKFPNAPRDECGEPRICPLDVGFPARADGAGYEGECHTEKPCTGCWDRPAPEE